MIIQCENCSSKFLVNDRDIPKEGRMVQCSHCSQKWFQTPVRKIQTPVRKIRTPVRKKRSKRKVEKEIEIESITKVIDPSSEQIDSETHFKEGLGFFGYIFLLTIITLSIIGVLKTFQNELIMYFPEVEYIFDKGEYIFESMDNIITIIKDLITSYY